jgi:hypothetical protein
VVIAVPLVRMMKVAFHEIVRMATVRDRFVSAAGAVRVFPFVRSAGMARSTSRRIRAALWQGMFIGMSRMVAVKMPVVQIVDVAFVFDRSVSAARTMRMRVLIMRVVVAHFRGPR